MKKYVKPELFYENYELSQYVAGCGVKVKLNLADPGSCAGTSDTWPKVFTSANSACSGGTILDEYCIMNAGGTSVTFGS